MFQKSVEEERRKEREDSGRERKEEKERESTKPNSDFFAPSPQSR